VQLNAESTDEARYAGRTLTSRALAQQLRGERLSDHDLPQGERRPHRERSGLRSRRPLQGSCSHYIGEDHIGRGVSWQEFEKSAAAGPIQPVARRAAWGC
jgi:hypothetical protein